MTDHSHCPDGCDHPQPFRATLKPEHAAQYPHILPGVEVEICGRCWSKFGEMVVMEPCTAETCPNE